MARKARPAAKTHDEIFASMVEGLDHAIGIARGEADREIAVCVEIADD